MIAMTVPATMTAIVEADIARGVVARRIVAAVIIVRVAVTRAIVARPIIAVIGRPADADADRDMRRFRGRRRCDRRALCERTSECEFCDRLHEPSPFRCRVHPDRKRTGLCFRLHDIWRGWMAAVSPVHRAFIGAEMRAETKEEFARVSGCDKKYLCIVNGNRSHPSAPPREAAALWMAGTKRRKRSSGG